MSSFLTKEARDTYEGVDPILVRKLNRCFRYLREDPYKHPNIGRLKGPLAGHLRIELEIGGLSIRFTSKSKG